MHASSHALLCCSIGKTDFRIKSGLVRAATTRDLKPETTIQLPK